MIYKVTYEFTDTAFMLVESTSPDEAAERLAKQLQSTGIVFEIKSINLLQEVPTKAEGYMN